MAEERINQSIPSTGLVDRYTGREQDEFSTDDNLSLKERIDRFEEVEYALGKAETYLQAGATKTEIYGDLKDVQDSVILLKASAMHHANGFTPEQLREAAEDPRFDTGILQAIADRRAATDRTSAPQSLTDRMRAADEMRDTSHLREDDRTLDEGRDEKG